MLNRAPWARYRQENYTLATASCWVLPIDYSFIKTPPPPCQPPVNKRLAIKIQLSWKHRSARRWNSFPDVEVTSIYYKHYPTFKFGNETRVRQGVWIPVRASLQSEVSSGAKVCSSPPACLLSQHLWITLYMFQTGWGKGFFAQTSDETYSQVLLTSHLLVGKEKFEPHSLLRPKKQPQITFKWKGWVRLKIVYPVVCMKKQHQLEGISLTKTFVPHNPSAAAQG